MPKFSWALMIGALCLLFFSLGWLACHLGAG